MIDNWGEVVLRVFEGLIDLEFAKDVKPYASRIYAVSLWVGPCMDTTVGLLLLLL